MSKKPTIPEIRDYLARRGATLTRAKMTLNSRPAYVAMFPNGRITTYSDLQLIDTYLNGTLISGDGNE